ncbi:MAG: zinc dependent phospholipase C family protein [Nitrospiraceae bacterium]|nr:zinc dependent phospholipase C family protein [Nitrospiraceae bacterium]
MPGSYAHLTMVGEARAKKELKKIHGFPREGIEAAGLYLKFLELGAVSPDYPYLDITSTDSKKWADAMHYTHTGDTVYAAAELVRVLPEGEGKMKCLAWLMGFTGHVVGDMCIHPVVELKVGPYENFAKDHRRCEMHQDAFIFPRLGLGMPQTAEHIRATILKCGSAEDPNKLDPSVKGIWERLLRQVHPGLFNAEPPEIDTWHHKCYVILEKLLPTSSSLLPCARHVCDGLGLIYPETDKVDKGFVENLMVPAPAGIDRRMHYDDVFDIAVGKVRLAWRDVLRHALGIEELTSFRGGEWNLDTGRDLSAENALVFWEVA